MVTLSSIGLHHIWNQPQNQNRSHMSPCFSNGVHSSYDPEFANLLADELLLYQTSLIRRLL